MSTRICCWTAALVAFAASMGSNALAQTGPAAERPRAKTPAEAPRGTLVRPRGPGAPFSVTPAGEARLDEVLANWEARSAKIKTLRCEVTLWTYDAVFGKKDADGNTIPTEGRGRIKYAAPDKGSYQIDGDNPQYWICDGRSIFEFKHVQKQLVEKVLPPELHGKAISDGPLPFVFGANAQKHKQRYFLRVVTPQGVEGQICLEAYPRFAIDAANFRRATLILDEKDMLPSALEIMLPNGKNRTVHQFEDRVVNGLRDKFFDQFTPTLPRGWKKIVENAPPAAAQGARRPPAAPATAKRDPRRAAPPRR